MPLKKSKAFGKKVYMEYPKPWWRRIVMSDPPHRNAISLAMLNGLKDAFMEAHYDDDVKLISLTGDPKGRAFSAGGDIDELYRIYSGDVAFEREMHGYGLHVVSDYIKNTPKIVMSVVNGYSLGGAVEWMLISDLIIAADDALISVTESLMDSISGPAAHLFLDSPSRRDALWNVITGRYISGKEAYETGLINKSVPSSKLPELEEEMSREISKRDAIFLAQSKEAMYEILAMGYAGYPKEIFDATWKLHRWATKMGRTRLDYLEKYVKRKRGKVPPRMGKKPL